MTFIVYVIFGVGVLLIASALDGGSIVQTLQKITSGQPINWTATPTSTASQQPTQVTNAHTQQQSAPIPPPSSSGNQGVINL